MDEEEGELYEFTVHGALRSNVLARAAFLFMTQGMLAVLVMSEVLYSDVSVWYTFASDQWIVFSRFMCGIVLHVSLSGEIK